MDKQKTFHVLPVEHHQDELFSVQQGGSVLFEGDKDACEEFAGFCQRRAQELKDRRAATTAA